MVNCQQLDIPHPDDESDVWHASLNQTSEEDGGQNKTGIKAPNRTKRYMSPLLCLTGMISSDSGTSESAQLSVSMVAVPPEDQHEDLETLMKSNTTLMELYPSMVRQVEWAQRRYKVFEAADSVVRKYRKLWQQPQRHLSDTQHASLGRCRPETAAGGGRFVDARPLLQPPLQAQPWSPGGGRSPQSRAQRWPVLVMEPADPPHAFKPQNCSVNETFNVPAQRELPCKRPVSPPRLHSPAKRLSLPHTERAESYSSPSRRSPFKPSKLLYSESSTRSPKAGSPRGLPRELLRPRPTSASSSPARSAAAPKRLFPQDTPVFQSHPQSPRPPAARGHHGLSRHLSFDASLLPSHASYSAKDLDEDLKKLFHRFVCQSKYSFFNSVPCHYCGKNPEANRKPSSSSLAALALSPLRPPLRKRVWEEGGDGSPGSKRYRQDFCASSPGSRRHSSEMLRRLSEASGCSPR